MINKLTDWITLSIPFHRERDRGYTANVTGVSN